MKLVIAALCFAVLAEVNSRSSSPVVRIFSKLPGQYGMENSLVCHLSGFHPPDVSIALLRNGVEIPGAEQTDLSFEATWDYHLTRKVPFTPQEGEEYSCRVKHQSKVNNHVWEPDM